MKYQTQLVVKQTQEIFFISLHPTVRVTYLNKKGLTRLTNIKLKLRVLSKRKNLKMRYKKILRTNVNFRSQLVEGAYTYKSLGNVFNLFDCSFLKKNKLYSKLKYSRSPQYDIVSGGVAALFSAFIGFLISEKFGIELVDSGDFYVLFMYIVFVSFSFRPLFRIVCRFEKATKAFSLVPFCNLLIMSSVFVSNSVTHYFKKIRTAIALFIY